MKKTLLLSLCVLLTSLLNAQVSEVLTFNSTSKPLSNKGYYEDQIYNNKYYYISNSADSKSYLYALDGTNEPEQIKEVTSFSKSSGASSYITNVGSFKSNNTYLFFTTTTLMNATGNVEYELWRTDGTTDGTIKLFSHFGNSISAPNISNTQKIANQKVENDLDGSILFFASVTANTRSLWISDGTVSGTEVVKDFSATAANEYYNYILEKVGDYYLFMHYNSTLFGYELWKTDGTTAGTVAIQNSLGGTQQIYQTVGLMNGRYYFNSLNEIFSTDGDVVTLENTLPTNAQFFGQAVFNTNNDLYYLVKNVVAPITYKLFHAHNTISAQSELKEFAGDANSYRIQVATDNGVLVNKIDNVGILASQIFVEKNTGNATTHSVFLDYNRNDNRSTLIEYNNDIYVGGTLKNDVNNIGNELWKYGTSNSSLVADIFPGTISLAGMTLAKSSTPESFFILNDKVYFVASVAAGTKLYTLGNDSPLGISNASRSKNKTSVYPNPTTGDYTLHVSSDLVGSEVRVYNVMGELVTHFNASQEDTKHNLGTGMYFLQIENLEGSYTQKILVK